MPNERLDRRADGRTGHDDVAAERVAHASEAEQDTVGEPREGTIRDTRIALASWSTTGARSDHAARTTGAASVAAESEDQVDALGAKN